MKGCKAGWENGFQRKERKIYENRKNGIFVRRFYAGRNVGGVRRRPFDEEEVKAAAEEVIEILNDGDVDTLVEEKWNSTMRGMADKDMMEKDVLPIVEELGAFEGFDKEAVTGNKDKDTEQEFAVAIIIGKYEKRKAQFTISFDEDMKVGGFYIK